MSTAQDLPTFIVIGAMKAGTTSLFHYLRHHDDIFMSRIKELDFFVTEGNWSRGFEWYRRQFSGGDGFRARGEASTLYSKWPEYDGVPERIARALPGVSLVYVVRDPIVRMRSHYQHRVMTGAETAPPEVALIENPSYLACSQYAMQLGRYLEHFPREQVLIVTSEALRADRRPTVQRVYDFLGVDSTRIPDVIGTEFYRTAERRTYPPAVWWARRMAKKHAPQAKRAKELVDSVLTRRASKNAVALAERDVPARPQQDEVISPELRKRLAELLHDDVARFRTYMPPDFDGWGLG